MELCTYLGAWTEKLQCTGLHTGLRTGMRIGLGMAWGGYRDGCRAEKRSGKGAGYGSGCEAACRPRNTATHIWRRQIVAKMTSVMSFGRTNKQKLNANTNVPRNIYIR